MALAASADFLVEIGTEELPPTALRDLMQAFAHNLAAALERDRLAHAGVRAFASPRRLALKVEALALSQPDREIGQRGPPVSVAFDASGNPTAAALAFADKCGVNVEELGRSKTAKGEWLYQDTMEKGRPASELLPAAVETALARLPVPRQMRWGDGDYEFVRPVHWVLMLHGEEVIDASILGARSGSVTRGHRFLAPGELAVASPDDYPGLLEEKGFVLADFDARRVRIVAEVASAATAAGGSPVGDAALYDEVAALTEWPVALTGSFDPEFLALPREVIVATLTSHQRYFPIVNSRNQLIARFVTVANLPSKDPDKVRDGNERVVRPRLADAAFFWERDRAVALAERRPALRDIVYQKGLGSIADKSERVARLAATIASRTGADPASAERAALLSKCDLTSGMVAEFPELQGVMGGYYAKASGEPEAVAGAIAEQYLPRFAGDRLPASATGQVLAIADKLDTLAGVFALGKRPSGNRDPFGLRRAALGILRILLEKRLDLDFRELIAAACNAQPVAVAHPAALRDEVYDFAMERLRALYVEQMKTPPEVFEAVRVRAPSSLTDFDARLRAVTGFVTLDASASLAAANKRIANILRQAGADTYGGVDTGLLRDAAERDLEHAIERARDTVLPMLAARAYGDALTELSKLRAPVDTFFDQVMVMTDDPEVRQNRLALLAELRALFFEIADISRLSTG